MYRIVSNPMVSNCIESYQIVSNWIVSYRFVSIRIKLYRIVSYRFVSIRINSYRTVSNRIASYDSYRIELNYSETYQIISNHIVPCWGPGHQQPHARGFGWCWRQNALCRGPLRSGTFWRWFAWRLLRPPAFQAWCPRLCPQGHNAA